MISIIGPSKRYAKIELCVNDESKDLPTKESDVEQRDIRYANDIKTKIDNISLLLNKFKIIVIQQLLQQLQI